MALQRLESRILKQQAVVKEPPSWPVVPGVAAWLEMVWWHLVMNALKHGGKNCHIELGWTTKADHYRFSVQDNGPGVPEILSGKLFREFNTLHAEQNVPGIGLSIVQRLLELQEGKCGHERPERGGALFFFTLPVDGPAASVRIPAPAPEWSDDSGQPPERRSGSPR
jgi:two-component system sensor histidine kinase KdpD